MCVSVHLGKSGVGPGTGERPFFSPGGPALAAHLPSWGWEEDGGHGLAGPMDSGLNTRPCHVEGLRGLNR